MSAVANTTLSRALALLQLLLLAAATWGRVVPNNVPICKRSDPQYDACVVKSVEAITPHLVKGIPKMRVPPCEPLVIPALAIDRNLEALKVRADLKNIRIYGGTTFVINKLKTDLQGLSLDLSVSFPHIYMVSDYDIDGRILVVPLKGRGEFRGNFTDVKGDIHGKGMLVNISGKQYLQVQKLTASADVKDAVPQIINKDKSTEAITNTASNFINENKRQVFQIIKPLVDDTLAAVLTEFANSILRTMTIDEILPD
ncbi:circadian clock-controlled protein daywake-like [Schistocerca americana]|uniref:circadian clock-controlled protein daywake-like n=1 Tax=Schistocerca americana TaxID=7009 RepID=UPI001F501A93|nr:circadian clock-controlled protein daywake-like [Schistocerca americana]